RRSGPPVIRLLDGLDWRSPGLFGPLHGRGDCLMDHGECPVLCWFDRNLPARNGDVILWRLPMREPGRCLVLPDGTVVPQDEQASGKWYVVVDGVEWLACRYFAIRRDPKFHEPFARLVAEVCYPGWPLESPAESQRL